MGQAGLHSAVATSSAHLTYVKIDQEINSAAFLPLIQEGWLSLTDERMCMSTG